MTTDLDVPALLTSWEIYLRSERKSRNTVDAYLDRVGSYVEWCTEAGVEPKLDRRSVVAWTADMLDAGLTANTAKARQAAVKLFADWLVAEGEMPVSELRGVKPPKVDQVLTPVLTDDQVRAMIAACKGPGFTERRDEAVIRLMVEVGLRATETVDLQLSDLDVSRGLATVTRGKGGKARIVPFGPQTARAIDRYLRVRRTHPRAHETGAVWLGERGRDFRYWGLHSALRARADRAGIDKFHPHMFRHTAASRWLAAGGSEGGLMAVAGWSDRTMLDRYAAATKAERAAAEARSLNLGDL